MSKSVAVCSEHWTYHQISNYLWCKSRKPQFCRNAINQSNQYKFINPIKVLLIQLWAICLLLVLDQTPSCRYFYFDVWFSNFNWFSEMSLLLTGSIIFGNILWIITADLFKHKVEQIFSIKYNLLKIVPSTNSSFVPCLTVNVHMICKSYKVLVLQKKQICGNISSFAESEVWSFDFGHY